MAEVRSGFYEVDDLTVELPKFKIEQTLELGSTLQQLGLETFFDDTQSDFSNFKAKDAKDTDPIIFTRARHKSFIEVNEEGMIEHLFTFCNFFTFSQRARKFKKVQAKKTCEINLIKISPYIYGTFKLFPSSKNDFWPSFLK